MQHPSLSLIIPCYNEQERITNMWSALEAFATAWQGALQIIIVNDGSTDNTANLILTNATYKKFLAQAIVAYVWQPNTGKGGAIATGVAMATTDYVLTLDADMATAPTELLQWITLDANIFVENKIVIASRTLPQSKLILISARRKTGNIFNVMVRKLTGLSFRDTQCGFKLYPTAIAKSLFANLQTKGWAHDVEILKKAMRAKYNIIELPITWNERDASKINVVRDGIKMLIDVMLLK
jgi:dolichyl-phosphate beta-glucosyltransferase